MKRIQIIFLVLVAITLLSVISSREDSNYYSEYNTRFTCGLKYDFELFDFSQEFKNKSSHEEITIFSIQNAVVTNNIQKPVNNLPSQFRNTSRVNKFFSINHDNLYNQTQKSLLPSRAPPFYS